MSINRYAARQDGNQAEIVDYLRAAGATVYIIKMPVDLLVGKHGKTALVEVKSLKTRYGKKGPNENQKSFMDTWRGGTVATVNDIEGARVLLAAMA